MDLMYDNFTNYINSITQTNNLSNFKSNGNVTGILEHVSFELGYMYFNYIKTHTLFTDEQIISYCKKNDKIGGGMKYDYNLLTTSPSNLRYLFHSHLILSHIQNLGLNEIKIVEVGGGYGGLCLALNELSHLYNINIKKYFIIDLPNISTLQKLYLSELNMNNVEFHSGYSYGTNINDNNLFLISNYCFSEIHKEHQKKYIELLFPKVLHGFMAWNWIPLYYFGFNVREEEEYPLTGNSYNKYIYF